MTPAGKQQARNGANDRHAPESLASSSRASNQIAGNNQTTTTAAPAAASSNNNINASSSTSKPASGQRKVSSANLLSPNSAYEPGGGGGGRDQQRRRSTLSANGFFIDYSCTRRRSCAASQQQQARAIQDPVCSSQFLASVISPVRRPSVAVTATGPARASSVSGCARDTPIERARYTRRASSRILTTAVRPYQPSPTSGFDRLRTPSFSVGGGGVGGGVGFAARSLASSRKTSIFDPAGHSLAAAARRRSTMTTTTASAWGETNPRGGGGTAAGSPLPAAMEQATTMLAVSRQAAALQRAELLGGKQELVRRVPVIGCSPTSIRASLAALDETRRYKKLLHKLRRHQKRKEKERIMLIGDDDDELMCDINLEQDDPRDDQYEDFDSDCDVRDQFGCRRRSQAACVGPVPDETARLGANLRRKSLRAIKDVGSLLNKAVVMEKRRRRRKRRWRMSSSHRRGDSLVDGLSISSTLSFVSSQTSSPSIERVLNELSLFQYGTSGDDDDDDDDEDGDGVSSLSSRELEQVRYGNENHSDQPRRNQSDEPHGGQQLKNNNEQRRAGVGGGNEEETGDERGEDSDDEAEGEQRGGVLNGERLHKKQLQQLQRRARDLVMRPGREKATTSSGNDGKGSGLVRKAMKRIAAKLGGARRSPSSGNLDEIAAAAARARFLRDQVCQYTNEADDERCDARRSKVKLTKARLNKQQETAAHEHDGNRRRSRARSISMSAGLNYWHYYYYLRNNSLDQSDSLGLELAALAGRATRSGYPEAGGHQQHNAGQTVAGGGGGTPMSDYDRRARLYINYSLARLEILNCQSDPVAQLSERLARAEAKQSMMLAAASAHQQSDNVGELGQGGGGDNNELPAGLEAGQSPVWDHLFDFSDSVDDFSLTLSTCSSCTATTDTSRNSSSLSSSATTTSGSSPSAPSGAAASSSGGSSSSALDFVDSAHSFTMPAASDLNDHQRQQQQREREPNHSRSSQSIQSTPTARLETQRDFVCQQQQQQQQHLNFFLAQQRQQQTTRSSYSNLSPDSSGGHQERQENNELVLSRRAGQMSSRSISKSVGCMGQEQKQAYGATRQVALAAVGAGREGAERRPFQRDAHFRFSVKAPSRRLIEAPRNGSHQHRFDQRNNIIDSNRPERAILISPVHQSGQLVGSNRKSRVSQSWDQLEMEPMADPDFRSHYFQAAISSGQSRLSASMAQATSKEAKFIMHPEARASASAGHSNRRSFRLARSGSGQTDSAAPRDGGGGSRNWASRSKSFLFPRGRLSFRSRPNKQTSSTNDEQQRSCRHNDNDSSIPQPMANRSSGPTSRRSSCRRRSPVATAGSVGQRESDEQRQAADKLLEQFEAQMSQAANLSREADKLNSARSKQQQQQQQPRDLEFEPDYHQQRDFHHDQPQKGAANGQSPATGAASQHQRQLSSSRFVSPKVCQSRSSASSTQSIDSNNSNSSRRVDEQQQQQQQLVRDDHLKRSTRSNGADLGPSSLLLAGRGAGGESQLTVPAVNRAGSATNLHLDAGQQAVGSNEFFRYQQADQPQVQLQPSTDHKQHRQLSLSISQQFVTNNQFGYLVGGQSSLHSIEPSAGGYFLANQQNWQQQQQQATYNTSNMDSNNNAASSTPTTTNESSLDSCLGSKQQQQLPSSSANEARLQRRKSPPSANHIATPTNAPANFGPLRARAHSTSAGNHRLQLNQQFSQHAGQQQASSMLALTSHRQMPAPDNQRAVYEQARPLYAQLASRLLASDDAGYFLTKHHHGQQPQQSVKLSSSDHLAEPALRQATETGGAARVQAHSRARLEASPGGERRASSASRRRLSAARDQTTGELDGLNERALSLLRKNSFACTILGARQTGKRSIVVCFVKLLNEFKLAADEFKREKLITKLVECSEKLQELASKREQAAADESEEQRRRQQRRSSRLNSWLPSGETVKNLLSLSPVSKKRLHSVAGPFLNVDNNDDDSSRAQNQSDQQQQQQRDRHQNGQRRHTTIEPPSFRLVRNGNELVAGQNGAESRGANQTEVGVRSRRKSNLLTVQHNNKSDTSINYETPSVATGSNRRQSDWASQSPGDSRATVRQVEAVRPPSSSHQLQVPSWDSVGLSRKHSEPINNVGSSKTAAASADGDGNIEGAPIDLGGRCSASMPRRQRRHTSNISSVGFLADQNDAKPVGGVANKQRRSLTPSTGISATSRRASSRTTTLTGANPLPRPRRQSICMSHRRRRILLSLKELNRRKFAIKFSCRRQISDNLIGQMREAEQMRAASVGRAGRRKSTIIQLSGGAGANLGPSNGGCEVMRSAPLPDAFLVVYSINDRDSFDYARSMIEQLRSISQLLQEDVPLPIMLVANKSDLERNREVKIEDGRAVAKKYSCKFIEISCTIGFNLDNLLVGLRTQLVLKHHIVLNSILRSDFQSPQKPKTTATNDNGISEQGRGQSKDKRQTEAKTKEPNENILVRFYKRYVMDCHEHEYDCDNLSKL